MSADEIDRYLEALSEPKRSTLGQLRRSILRLVPDAEEGLAYGVPAFRSGGKLVAGFSAAKRHLTYLPHSGTVLGELDPAQLHGLGVSKGALRFPIDAPLPDELVAELIAARRRELDG